MRQFEGDYIDDILLYTKTLEDRLQVLRKVYDKLRQESFFAGPDKCTCTQPKVEYCGFILCKHGIKTVGPFKIKKQITKNTFEIYISPAIRKK